MELFQFVPGEVGYVGWVAARHDTVRVTRQQIVLRAFGKQLLRVALQKTCPQHDLLIRQYFDN